MRKMNGLTRGVVVFLILAVLTAIEYIAGTMEFPVLVLVVLGLAKAALVLWYFMHLGTVLNPGSGEDGGH